MTTQIATDYFFRVLIVLALVSLPVLTLLCA